MGKLLIRRRTMMKLADDEASWDYEWYASSRTLPLGMTAFSYKFSGDPVEMYVSRPNLDFNHVGAAEILVEMRWPSPNKNNPQIVIKRAERAGAKVYGSTANGKIMTNISGQNQATNFNDNEYHIINLKYDGNIFILTIDGITSTGQGVSNNDYIPLTGITTSAPNHDAYFRTIKYRALA